MYPNYKQGKKELNTDKREDKNKKIKSDDYEVLREICYKFQNMINLSYRASQPQKQPLIRSQFQ